MKRTSNSRSAFGGRLGLRTQLLCAFGLLSLLVGGGAATAQWGLGRVGQAASVAAQQEQLGISARQTMTQMLLLRGHEKDFLLAIDDADARATYADRWDSAYTALGKAIQNFAAAATTDEDRQQAERWQTQSADYQQAFTQLVEASNTGSVRTVEAASAALAPATGSIRQLMVTTTSVAQNKGDAAAAAETALIALIARTRRFALMFATVALLTAVALSLVFIRRIMQPIRALHAATRRLAGGDLTTRVALNRQDELGALAQGFNSMGQALEERIAEQQRAHEELRAASDTKIAKEYLEGVVRNYSTFADQVAQGNLTVRLDVADGQDELALLGHNLNRMVRNLHSITQQVQQANSNIASAASEILAVTTQQAASATEQAAAITQTTTTVEEVKAIAQQTVHQAQQLAQQGQHMLDVAHQGTRAVDQTVEGMGLIRERVDSIAHTILALAEQTTAIGEITASVTDLADQSNLLALNAAIEAARAGEQGKGFAVVAQHVRDLAERSKSATQQVHQILTEIQRATSAAVMVTEEGTKGVTQGAGLAAQAGKVIMDIAREVESGSQSNMQVAAAAQQQQAGMDQIGQAMGAIQQATTETLSSTRQAERAAKDLNALAQSLQQAVAAYQV